MALTELRDYQLDAIRRMKNGCILCGDTGSGKSLTALAYYYFQHGGKIGKYTHERMVKPRDLYIITTAQKRDNLEWEQELTKFLLSTDPKINAYTNKVVIDSWNNIKKYVGVTGAFFIFDEQRVVGYGAWSKSFIKISKGNLWILLSATPGDTWQDYIPVFIANGFYKNKSEFIEEHVVYDWRCKNFRKVYMYLNTRRLIRLRDSILVTMDYHKPAESHHFDLWLGYDMAKYHQITRTRWNPWENRPIETPSEFCMLLRRIVNSDESRQVALLELLEDHPKIIVFYSFDYELDILRNIGYGEGVEVAEWNGHLHQPIPDSDSWVYLVNYRAGAEGWNCVKTDTIVFYSQDYSYRTMKQASGRIDRLNTPFRDLYYYHFKSKSSIDLAISRALAVKKDFNVGKFAFKH